MNKGIIVHTVILNDKKEILILQRATQETVYPNMWDIPGGTLRDGEDPAVGALREIREETGLQVDDLRLFSYTSNVDKTKDTQFIRLIFFASYVGEEVKVDSNEHQDYKWINPAQIHTIATVDYLPKIIELMLSKKLPSFLEYFREMG